MALPYLNIRNIPEPGIQTTIGMLKPVIVANLEYDRYPFNLTIKSNGRVLMTEYYTLPSFKSFELDLQDMLSHAFEYYPPSILSRGPQLSSNLKEIDIIFSAGTYTEATHFFLVNNRLENINVADYLRTSFFTFQPRHKKITPDAIEVLTFYVENEQKALKCKAYSHGRTESVVIETVIGGLIDYVVHFGELSAKFTLCNIQGYYFFLEDYDDQATMGQFYEIEEQGPTAIQDFYFENSAGGFDHVRARGTIKDKDKFKTDFASRNRTEQTYYIEISHGTSVNSGYLASDAEKAFFHDFLSSKHKYILLDGQLLEITVTEGSADSTHKELGVFNFDYQISHRTPVNIPRNTIYQLTSGSTSAFCLSPQIAPLSSKVNSFKFDFIEANQSLTLYDEYTITVSDRILEYYTPTNKFNYPTYLYWIGSVDRPTKTIKGFITVYDHVMDREASALLILLAQ